MVRDTLQSVGPRAVSLGDNGSRLAVLRAPALIRQSELEGFRVLPGTDPFPFAKDYRRVGGFGFLAGVPIDESAPWAALRSWLEGLAAIAARLRRGFGPDSIRDQPGGHTVLQPLLSGYRPMKMLVVAPQPFFSPRGTPFSVYYRALVMSELGVAIDLLTYGAGQDIDVAGIRTIRIPRLRFLEPIPVGPSWQEAFSRCVHVPLDTRSARPRTAIQSSTPTKRQCSGAARCDASLVFDSSTTCIRAFRNSSTISGSPNPA